MPLGAGVIPNGTGLTYTLDSWNKVSNAGHYLELHGYYGLSTDSSQYVYYSDVAGTYADSYAGNWMQASYAVYMTNFYNQGGYLIY